MDPNPKKGNGGDHGHGYPITIDDRHYKVEELEMEGSELRALPEPDVPGDRDLWLEVPGPGDDVLVRPEKKIPFHPGAHFYTAPGTINPGA